MDIESVKAIIKKIKASQEFENELTLSDEELAQVSGGCVDCEALCHMAEAFVGQPLTPAQIELLHNWYVQGR